MGARPQTVVQESKPVRFEIVPSASLAFEDRLDATPVISPDGKYIAFVGNEPKKLRQSAPIWIRALDLVESRMLPGTEGAAMLFWSPDSRHIGFVSSGKLSRVGIDGVVQRICDVGGTLEGATWNRDGIILFGDQGPGGIYKVSDQGGQPVVVTKAAPDRNVWPYFLLDGNHFLFHERGTLYTAALDDPDPRRLMQQSSSKAQYAGGKLFFVRDGRLIAQHFDTVEMRLGSEIMTIAEGIASGEEWGRAAFSVSESGSVVYSLGFRESVTTLTWFDREGRKIGQVGGPGAHINPELSPNGKHVAVGRQTDPSGSWDLWSISTDTGIATRLTSHPLNETYPVWSPDGRMLAYQSSEKTSRGTAHIRLSDGTGDSQSLGTSITPTSWIKDGTALFVNSEGDLKYLDMKGDRQLKPYLATPFGKEAPRFHKTGSGSPTYPMNPARRKSMYVNFQMPKAESGRSPTPVVRNLAGAQTERNCSIGPARARSWQPRSAPTVSSSG